ncbi:MAG: sensor histidine kinase [Leeuwenhoekiella sp.]
MIFIVFGGALQAQHPNLQKDKERIQHYQDAHQSKQALTAIDSILLNDNYATTNLNFFRIKKIEALIRVNLLEDAMALALEILNSPSLTKQEVVETRIYRALIFEIIEQPSKALADLDSVSVLYDNRAKDELFGKYLYRRASLLRVNDQPERALQYVDSAYNFGKAQNYWDVIANASMLKAFIYRPTDSFKAKSYAKTALEIWSDQGDLNGTCYMYLFLTRLEIQNNNLENAMQYLDTLQSLSSKNDNLFLLANIHKEESKIFKAQGKYREALEVYTVYKEYDDAAKEQLNSIATNQQDFNFKIKKEALQKQKALNELKSAEQEEQFLLILLCVTILALTVVILLLLKLKWRNKQIKSQNAGIAQQNLLLENTLTEKETLLKEAHHRIKNNLALVLGLVYMHMDNSEDKPTKAILSSLEMRIQAVALAHQLFMYDTSGKMTKDFSIRNYVSTILDSQQLLAKKEIILNKNIEDKMVGLDNAMPVGLILNELVSNSIKHAKPPKNEKKTISISLRFEQSFLVIDYNDNGTHFRTDNPEGSLGTYIIENMVKQLEGSLIREGSHQKIRLKIKK